jgi:hypothetical protein
MPRFREHLAGGAVAAGVVNVLVQLEAASANPDYVFDWGELLLCCVAGAGAACLPDLLEPANSPNHRKNCHSFATAAWLLGQFPRST